ncbi:MAG: DegV family protein [Anaerolineae bacterium]|nr:DegV family protein [Anaerolineae bacterium]
MARARIITDSTAYLPPDQIARHEITVLPIDIYLGDHKIRVSSGHNLRLLFQRIAADQAQTTKAVIPPSAFEEAYSQLGQKTDQILVIVGSSKLSSAFAAAKSTANAFLGRCRIAVLDSMATSWGLGLLVKAAAEAAEAGQSLDEIVRLVRGMLPHIYVVLFVERLDYLEKGNRIGPAQALLGTMLNIKPLLIMEEGEIIPLEKVRTRTSAIEKLADFVAEFATIEQVVIMRSPLGNDTELLVEHLNLILPGRAFPVIEYDAVLASHLGPDAMGVTVYESF